MHIKWKKKFKPSLILERISSVRTVNPEGGPSAYGFELENCLPVLQSMLEFPSAAEDLDTNSLVWIGLNKVRDQLTPDSFLRAINEELSKRLATKENVYLFLTSISIDNRDIPRKLIIDDVEISFLPGDYPIRFKSRIELLRADDSPVTPEPRNYCRLIAKVKAKSPTAAVSKALRAIDLQRALWCLMGNPRIQIVLGDTGLAPINVVRLGSLHTLHLSDGNPAFDGFWSEPGFKETKIFRLNKPNVVRSNSQWTLRQISLSKYGGCLSTALLRFVRALDESDANTAFLRLWGALESLSTSGGGNNDSVVSRCSALFRDSDFHRQVLEHLREYRNASVHAGEESDNARIHCYQLQLYFVNLIWFHLRSAKFFRSLDEAKSFLDLPMDKEKLQRQLKLIRKAQRFIE